MARLMVVDWGNASAWPWDGTFMSKGDGSRIVVLTDDLCDHDAAESAMYAAAEWAAGSVEFGPIICDGRALTGLDARQDASP